MNEFPIITALTLAPIIGGLLLVGLSDQQARLGRALALLFSFVPLALILLIWSEFDNTATELQFVERYAWIPSLGIEYYVGLDGLSLMMLLLAAILTPMAMLASWNITTRVPIFFALMLFLESGLFGVFTAMNFFHWFIFWEIGLIPAFFLIKLWGGHQRSQAAVQFFVYTMAGSVCLLLSFLGMYLATGTFEFSKLQELAQTGVLSSAFEAKLGWYSLTRNQLAMVIFSGVFLGFAVKVPLMPFHTWLPLAYAEAPTGATMLLTGAMSKMGVYGFIRILLPIFPDQTRQALTVLLWLVVISIVLSACAALAQRELKRVLAYSSINHLGYCMLGTLALAAAPANTPYWVNQQAVALNGVILQMFNHGITAAALFCFVGYLQQRANGRNGLNDFGGIARVVPTFTYLMCIALFASLGLPGLSGFAGEFLIFSGAYSLATWATALSAIGLLVSAIFLLVFIRKVFHGPLNPTWTSLPDLTRREKLAVVPAIALMVLLGLYPRLVVDLTNATVLQWIGQMKF